MLSQVDTFVMLCAAKLRAQATYGDGPEADELEARIERVWRSMSADERIAVGERRGVHMV